MYNVYGRKVNKTTSKERTDEVISKKFCTFMFKINAKGLYEFTVVKDIYIILSRV